MSANITKNHNIVRPIKAITLEDTSKDLGIKEYDVKDKKPSWVNIVVYWIPVDILSL